MFWHYFDPQILLTIQVMENRKKLFCWGKILASKGFIATIIVVQDTSYLSSRARLVFATIHDMNFPLYLIYRHHHLTIACTV
jgi:hypothetical protein